MVRLGIMTCQRGSDLIRMGPEHRDRNGIWCRPKKTRKRRRAFHIPLASADALEIDRWAETPVTFTNSRWLKPIERFRDDLYLYSQKAAPSAAAGRNGLPARSRNTIGTLTPTMPPIRPFTACAARHPGPG